MKVASKSVNPRTLKVISICSVCGEPVNANNDDLAYRHGFKRYRKRRFTSDTLLPTNNFSQEDAKPCPGSGQEVIYKRVKRVKK